MKLVSGIVDSGFFAQSALSAEVATKDSLGRNISETYLTGVDLTPYQTTAGMTAYANSAEVTGTAQYGLTTAGWSEITGGGGVTGDFELSAGSGISIEDFPLEQKTVISVTAQGGNPEVEQAVIDNSATWNTVSDKLDTTAFSDVSGTFLTAHQSLADYQTIAGMTAYQPVGSYLTADALDNVSGDWNEVSAKLDTSAFSDVSGTFLTAHQDISNKLDTTAFSDVSSTFLTAVPDTYLQNTDLSTEDGKVTAISGIPLSAGGDVPEGVMVESGLEYNAVNEISGYNGSAIAQYGAEKQWLQHDDTIVHVSNSAQYALGVNLSAVAQLLGVDETVLWSGDINENNLTGSLSEPISSFNKVKILTKINRSTPDAKQWFEFDTDREYYTMLGGLTNDTDTSAGGPFDGLVMISLTGGNVKYVNGYQRYWNSTAAEHRMFASIYKVIGIGRKEV